MNENFIRGIRINWRQVEQGSYLHGIPALRSLHALEFTAPATLFVGENGTGKSTLLEAIAVAYGFNPEGGTLNYRFSTYDEGTGLSGALLPVKGVRRAKFGCFFRAESFFNVASKAEDYRGPTPKTEYYARYGGRALHEQSHGESFLAYVAALPRAGLYLMDEPEAALSPQRQLALLAHIHAMAKQGAQFLIATHSPILLGLPGAQLLCFDGGRVHPCRWQDTASYQVTAAFLQRRDAMLREMLDEEGAP